MKKNLIEGMRQAALDVAQDSFNKGYLSALKDVRNGFDGNADEAFTRQAIVMTINDLIKQVELIIQVKDEATK